MRLDDAARFAFVLLAVSASVPHNNQEFRVRDPFVSHKELMASGINWKYPDAGGAINRTSPAAWAKAHALATPAKFHGETN